MSRIVLGLAILSHQLYIWRVPALPRLVAIMIRLVFGCHVAPGTRIGRHCTLAYGGLGTVIHKHVMIGANVYIGPHVCLGTRNGSTQGPTIGQNCLIGTGATVLGPVTVGPNAVVGAGAVVVDSVAPNTVVAGVPARVIRRDIDIRDYRTSRDIVHIAKPVPIDHQERRNRR